MRKVSGIYTISYDGRIAYVGRSNNCFLRFHQHKTAMRRGVHKNFIMQRIYNKHGMVFDFEVLEEHDVEYLPSFEQFWINTINPFANLSSANGFKKHTEESKLKMKLIASKRGSEYYKALGKKGVGNIPKNKGIKGVFKHTEDAKIRIGIASKGNKYRLGNHPSKETLKKLSECNKLKNSKMVLNIENGIYYESLKEAALSVGVNYKTVHLHIIGGKRKNKYPLKYV